MKTRYRLVRLGNRNGMFYCNDTLTGSRTSLETKNPEDAQRLIVHKNETQKNPEVNRKIGMAYLYADDPSLTTRTWNDVMKDIVKDKSGATLARYQTAMADSAFDLLRKKIVVRTKADDFLTVLRVGTVSTNVYLRRLQNHCLDLDWLPKPILPKKKFPKVKHKDQRAITPNEHVLVIGRETNPERRDFYELCWYFGASQSDTAHLQAEDIDYDRLKNGKMGGVRIGDKAWEVILRRPRIGALFPYLITVRASDRATEFKQRCQGLGIEGVTLHSYRYAWAERGADNAYPERYAQRVLGQGSKIVHRAYAKKAHGQLPSLEEYEDANRKAMESGKILVVKPEAEVPELA